MALDPVHFDAGACGVFRLGGEGVVKDSLNNARARFVGVEGHVAVRVMKSERAKVVEAEDVVGVRVRVEDCVNVADLFTQYLFAEIRAGVDEDAVSLPTGRR